MLKILIFLGQTPSPHVVLNSVGVDNTGFTIKDTDFIRIKPDGTPVMGPSMFRVPKGQFFVATDVDWQFNYGPPGGIQSLRIFIQSIGAENTGIANPVFESTILLISEGFGGISEAMTSGFVVSSNGRIVVDSVPGKGNINHIIIRGYLCEETSRKIRISRKG